MRLLKGLCCFALILSVCAPLAAAEDMGTYWWGVTKYELSDEDRDLIERVVYAESGGTELDGMIGVAQTIRERAESWGMTAREVVLQKGQYAPPYQGEVSEDVRDAVAAVFDRGERVFAGYTTHFHHKGITPYWTKNKIKRGQIGVQVFWGADEEIPKAA